MAMIELMCRYYKEPTDSASKNIELELDTQELIKGGNFNRDIERERLIKKQGAYEYGEMVFNLKDVSGSNKVDSKHTHITFYNGIGRTFKIGYEQFKAIYQTLMGIIINDFTNVALIKPYEDEPS